MPHPSLRSWLGALPQGCGRSAAFETRVAITLGGATSAIACGLEHAGYRHLARAEKFYVKGKFGPLREAELERARQWGAKLAQAMR
jgi:hypothetical protein